MAKHRTKPSTGLKTEHKIAILGIVIAAILSVAGLLYTAYRNRQQDITNQNTTTQFKIAEVKRVCTELAFQAQRVAKIHMDGVASIFYQPWQSYFALFDNSKAALPKDAFSKGQAFYDCGHRDACSANLNEESRRYELANALSASCADIK